MAAKLARLVYRMLRYGMQFVDRGADFYAASHPQREINSLKRKAAKPPTWDSKSSAPLWHRRSFRRGEKDSPDAHLGGARAIGPVRTRSSHVCLSAVVPAFAEPDIHSLSQILADRHRRLSVCSLPVLKQSEESLGGVRSPSLSRQLQDLAVCELVSSCCFFAHQMFSPL
jgi:hypothetical protein